jgi:Mrp family chromosome partitioning ATPase
VSRYFDLMTQLELELRAKETPVRDVIGDSAGVELAPVVVRYAKCDGGEEMLRLVQRVFLSDSGGAPRQIVVCGVDRDNGSSSICAQAGQMLAANSSLSVCIVDANARAPHLSGMFGFNRMTTFASTTTPVLEQCVKVGENLWLARPNILTDNSRWLLPVRQIRNRLAQLRDVFEYVLIDAPGTSVSGDAQVLSQIADGTILVIEANDTRRLTARKAKETLEASSTRLLGTVLHNRTFPIPEKLYKRL